MKYRKISVISNRFSADIISQIMFDLGADGVSIEDPADFYDLVQSENVWDYVEQKDLLNREDVVVISMYDNEDPNLLTNLKEKLDEIKPYGFTYSEIVKGEVDSNTWENEWQIPGSRRGWSENRVHQPVRILCDDHLQACRKAHDCRGHRVRPREKPRSVCPETAGLGKGS